MSDLTLGEVLAEMRKPTHRHSGLCCPAGTVLVCALKDRGDLLDLLESSLQGLEERVYAGSPGLGLDEEADTRWLIAIRAEIAEPGKEG